MGTRWRGMNKKISEAEAVICCPSNEGGMNRIVVHLEMHTRCGTPMGKTD